MNKKQTWMIIGILIILLIVINLIVFLPRQEKVIKIGSILPLSGEAAYWGENARKGIDFAVNDINEAGGINGKQLKVIFEDGLCDPKVGTSALQKLIEIDKVSIVIGEICSSSTLAMAPIAEKNKVVLITPCSESPKISEAGEFIFRTWTPNNRQALKMAEYAKNNLNLDKIGILLINNDFGVSLAEAFKNEFQRLGGEIVANEKYDQKSKDFNTQITKIKSKNPEAIYLVSYQPDAIIAIKQIKEQGLNVPILGTSGLDSVEEVFVPLGDLSEGIIFSELEDSTTEEFRERYYNQFDKEWPGIGSCASVAYDDIMIIAKAIEKGEGDSLKIRDYLANLKGHQGVSGEITFDENGDLDRTYEIFIVENNLPKKIS